MTIESLCLRLLEIGKTESYQEAIKLPGAGSHREVLRIASGDREHVQVFFQKLGPGERQGFFKAVAAYEDTVDGLGSVTLLERLLPDLPDEDHSTLDWVLTHTKAYWYYAHGARSYAEIQERKRAHAIRKDNSFKREQQREAEAKERKASIATSNLYNAVRRGDVKAVRGLLAKGADPGGETPDGLPLGQYALAQGHQEIAGLLANAKTRYN